MILQKSIQLIKDEIIVMNIENAPMNKSPCRQHFNYISHCLLNKKNEKIIFIVCQKSIYMYNIDLNIMTTKENV